MTRPGPNCTSAGPVAGADPAPKIGMARVTAHAVPVGRSAHGMATANHFLAAKVGAKVLSEGGTAVDAAVAMSFALGVVEPAMSGIGGRGYLLVLPPGASRPIVFDGHERAPLAATPTMFTPNGTSHDAGWGRALPTAADANRTGPLAVATPAVLLALVAAHAEFGVVPMPRLMVPARYLAKAGFEVDAHLAGLIARNAGRLGRFDATAEIFLPGGRPLGVGDLLVQEDLSRTLDVIAREGPAALHGGTLGDAVAGHVRRLGGVLSMRDLVTIRIERGAPLTTTFRGHAVHGLPGPTGAVSVAQILGMLEAFPQLIAGDIDVDYLDVVLNVCRLAFLDRYRPARHRMWPPRARHRFARPRLSRAARRAG